LLYAGAKTTLRLSGANKMNVQNFPRGGKLRKAIRAKKDHVIIKADQSNIECRMNMWFWDQDDVLMIFRNKGDVYSDMATDIFGYPVNRKKFEIINGEKVYPQFAEGFVGKTTVLSLGYGAGPERLRHALATGKEAQVKLSLEECRRIVYDVYRVKNWRVAAGWQQAQEWLKYLIYGKGQIEYKCITIDADEHKIWGPDGTFLYYPAIYEDERGDIYYKDQGGSHWVKIYGGKLVENIIQWLAGCTVRGNMRDIADRGYRLVGQEHDALYVCVHESEADKALNFVLNTMKATPSWAPGLPLDAEGDIKPHYS
jgi:DNA polymerase